MEDASEKEGAKRWRGDELGAASKSVGDHGMLGRETVSKKEDEAGKGSKESTTTVTEGEARLGGAAVVETSTTDNQPVPMDAQEKGSGPPQDEEGKGDGKGEDKGEEEREAAALPTSAPSAKDTPSLRSASKRSRGEGGEGSGMEVAGREGRDSRVQRREARREHVDMIAAGGFDA